jgi:protein O-mannosyl-transferase
MEEPIQHQEPNQEESIIETVIEERPTFRYFPFFNKRQPIFVLALIGLIFNCTSIFNEYALDDSIIIHQNAYVLKGIKGIKDILSSDAYDSFYKRMNATDQLQGGRYRPIAAMSYAIEQEFLGTYRSGYYLRAEDCNKNGVLDTEKVSYTNYANKPETNYEYNDFEDGNHNGKPDFDECYSCWDKNHNFKDDAEEDLNVDGVFNEVDCQVYGASLRHFNNSWLYVLACIFVYILFSRYLLKNQQDIAFLAGLIFIIHPVHSEVVANIKGRDEIFSILFITLTFIYLFRYLKEKNYKTLALGSLFFFLALMSKEYAVILFILVPLALYMFSSEKINLQRILIPVGLFVLLSVLLILQDVNQLYLGLPTIYWFVAALLLYFSVVIATSFQSIKNKHADLFISGLFSAGMLYLVLRLNAVNMGPGVEDTELLNNPFLLANAQEEFATKMVVLFKYLSLSLFPHPLICDYSYATFAYPNFTDLRAIFGSLLYATLIFIAVKLCFKKHILGFALSTYLLFILMVSNLFFHTGLMMLESYLFHATLGTAICLAWLFVKGFDRLTGHPEIPKRAAFLALLVIITFLAGCKTWERNWDWKNDVTLFLKDVKHAPHSVLVLGNAGARWIDLADTKEITGIGLSGESNAVFNDYNGTLKITDEEMLEGGFKTKREAALNKGITYLKHAVELHPKYVNGFLNLGLASYKIQDDFNTILYWKLAERLYPNNPYLNNYYEVYCNLLKTRAIEAFNKGDYQLAVTDFTRWTIVKPNNDEAWRNLGGALFNAGKYSKAKECWKKALELNPSDLETERLLKMRPGRK